MEAPAGPPTRLNASPFGGRSASVAVAVNVSRASSFTVLFPIAARTGATFTSLTVILTMVSPESTGVPLSVATTLKVYVPGPCTSVGVQVNSPVLELMPAPAGTGFGPAASE